MREKNFLIVDDDHSKAREVANLLLDNGIDQRNIDTCSNAYDAKEKMSEKRYDMLILDLGLPYRVENFPSIEVGKDLLEEITERNEYYPPRHIICITAIEDEISNLKEYFSSKYWQLVIYSSSSDSWKSKISDSLKYIINEKEYQSKERYLTDVLIVTALEEPELSAVLSINAEWSEQKYLDNVIGYYEGTFMERSGRRINIIACACSSMGMVSSTIATTIMLREFRPRLAIMTGICAGFSAEVEMGDPIIASPAWNYQTGKITQVEELINHKLEIKQYVIDHSLLTRLGAFAREINGNSSIEDGFTASKRPNSKPNIRIGAFVSGDAVIASEERMKEIATQDRKMHGLDMEVAGFYQSCHSTVSPAPLYFAIKSVVDLGDSQKSDKIQEYGSKLTANLAVRFVDKHIDFIRSR